MKKTTILYMGLLLGILLIAGCKGQTTNNAATGEVKEFNTVISGYSYNPASIKVNFGDAVRINIKNNDNVMHGIALPVFGVQKFVQPGQTTTIQFVANKRGAPETFCSTDHGEKLLIEVN